MNVRRTLAISRRIADLFRRDHRTLALVFVAPIVIMALLGWVIRDQAPTTTRLAIVNLAGPIGEVARSNLEDLASSAGMAVRDDITTDQAARQALRETQIDIAVELAVQDGRAHVVFVTLGLNPSDDSARIAELGGVVTNAISNIAPVVSRETIYGSPTGNVFDALAPALVGFVVFFLVFMLTGISFLRERIGGTLERLLATPVRRSEIVVGYSAGFTFFAILQVALILAFLLWSVHIGSIGPLPEINLGLGVPIAGSVGLAFVVMVLLAISAVNLGIFLSTFARTEFQILQFIPLVIVPQALLSGIAWPVESLPGWLEPIARVLPMTYGIDGLREVLVKGVGLADPTVQLDIIVLAVVTIVLAVLATMTIRREVA